MYGGHQVLVPISQIFPILLNTLMELTSRLRSAPLCVDFYCYLPRRLRTPSVGGDESSFRSVSFFSILRITGQWKERTNLPSLSIDPSHFVEASRPPARFNSRDRKRNLEPSNRN
ncbi:hypothetical protein CDAR_565511 [Caerostris darwini]|uniref:Uncharacterized protein n=1 Tax=Caerostris darwini TaxID=1538125 RepID=A0AAV4TWX4_9ARAC|nr:hypothetical protein CDAR_565511 [Caerostris darwini]